MCLLFKRNKLLVFPGEPARQSSSLDSPVIKIKWDRVNGYIASCGRAKMLSGSVLHPKYASLCKERVFFQLFQTDCCSFGFLPLAVLCLHTQNLELTAKEPLQLSSCCITSVCRLHTTLAPQAPWHCFPGCLWLCWASVLHCTSWAVPSELSPAPQECFCAPFCVGF